MGICATGSQCSTTRWSSRRPAATSPTCTCTAGPGWCSRAGTGPARRVRGRRRRRERPGGALPPRGAWTPTSELEREMLAHLPLARTELGVRVLLAQTGRLGGLRRGAAAGSGRDAGRELLADRSLWWLLHPPRVAIVGAANAGKSTLANQLFAQERSITADLPGTTRDWVGEVADIDGLPVMLVDTPGPASDGRPHRGSGHRWSRRADRRRRPGYAGARCKPGGRPEQESLLGAISRGDLRAQQVRPRYAGGRVGRRFAPSPRGPRHGRTARAIAARFGCDGCPHDAAMVDRDNETS